MIDAQINAPKIPLLGTNTILFQIEKTLILFSNEKAEILKRKWTM